MLVTYAPRRFQISQWKRVFFTDESRFTFLHLDGRRRVYRCCFTVACGFERDRLRFGSIMVSGGISHRVIVLAGNVAAIRYRKEVSPLAAPILQQHFIIFQHNNAWSFVAIVSQHFLQTKILTHSPSNRTVPIRTYVVRTCPKVMMVSG